MYTYIWYMLRSLWLATLTITGEKSNYILLLCRWEKNTLKICNWFCFKVKTREKRLQLLCVVDVKMILNPQWISIFPAVNSFFYFQWKKHRNLNKIVAHKMASIKRKKVSIWIDCMHILSTATIATIKVFIKFLSIVDPVCACLFTFRTFR